MSSIKQEQCGCCHRGARGDFENPAEGRLTQTHSRKRLLEEMTELNSEINDVLCEEAGVISITEVLMGAWTGMIESLEPPRVISYRAYARLSTTSLKKKFLLKKKPESTSLLFYFLLF